MYAVESLIIFVDYFLKSKRVRLDILYEEMKKIYAKNSHVYMD